MLLVKGFSMRGGPMASQRVTIAQVAKKAGVSATAVSFAFNRPEQLGKETIDRIMAAAEELGYAPNPYAKALLSGRSGVIGVLVPQPIHSIFANPFFHTFLQGVGSLCDDKRLALLTLSPLEGSLEEAIAQAPVDGFIIVGLNEEHDEVAPLRKRKVPFVIVDGDSVSSPSINSDDEQGAFEAANYLIQKGHRDIAILTFETPYGHLEYVYYGVGGRRMLGYKKAFEASGLPWENEILYSTVASIEGGFDSFQNLWESSTRKPTALIAVSDAMAIGAVKAATELGLCIPKDIEIIGFDDIPLANLISPTLSTVKQPIFDKGYTAAETLLDLLDNQNNRNQHIILPTALVLRESTL
jgi:DNA-binding LacI/PurR family transcriptional regulator